MKLIIPTNQQDHQCLMSLGSFKDMAVYDHVGAVQMNMYGTCVLILVDDDVYYSS